MGVLLVMDCCVGDGLLCWMSLVLLLRVVYEWNGTSPVGFVLSLFYLCAFQMNPVCCLARI